MSAEPGLLDSPEYAQLYELIAGRPDSLRLARLYWGAAADLQLRLVADERMRGASLSKIGGKLGVSKQAVAAMLSRMIRH